MNVMISFTIAMVAWVSYEASAAETSCRIGSHGSIFLPHQHHALIGHSFVNHSRTVRIQCMMLCWRHSRCLSFNHEDIKGICQLNDASKEDFPDSYKQDDGFSYFGSSSKKAKPLPAETMITTKTEQETSQAEITTTKLISTVSTEQIPDTTPAKVVCSDPLGMESRLIPDSSFSASNAGHVGYGPEKSRLNSNAAWCSVNADNNPWFRVLLDETVTLTGIVTQGRHYSNVWTKTFKVKLDVAVDQLEYVTGTNGLPIEFSGNTDSQTPVTNLFPEAVRAKVVRIEPVTKERGFCIRFELLGCRDSE